MRKFNENKGITLVALVVTIVVLLILAGITITALFSENGIIKKAQEAKNATEQDQTNTQEGLANLADQMAVQLGEDVSSLGKLAKAGTIVTKRTEVADKVGNKVVVPKGFRLTTEGATVQDGVVIEDSAGNQFVWIPVGIVTRNDGTKSNDIKLGRYTFADSSTTTPGEATLVQAAYTAENPTNYVQEVVIDTYYKEFATRSTPEGSNDLNAIAKNLAGFVDSVANNGGYYLARYEASYGSGYDARGSDDTAKFENAKPLSKKSIEFNEGGMTYTEGRLWNYITQLNASKVCKNMYKENKDINGGSVGVESDLVNSYAWDTAIVYIQEMGIENFANKGHGDVGNATILSNTGSNKSDRFCNIYDMVANLRELSTEYSSGNVSTYVGAGVCRGGDFHTDFIVGWRDITVTYIQSGPEGFRTLLYVK